MFTRFAKAVVVAALVLTTGLHWAALQTVAWTINEPEHMRRLIATGVNGIITDYPDRLLDLLREQS